MKLMVINGPNLDRLEYRRADLYGEKSLADIMTRTNALAYDMDIELEWYQSPVEGEIIKQIHTLLDKNFDGLIINPGAYAHTSLAIADALELLDLPIVEVHLSNLYQREELRQTMLTAKASTMIMSGLKEDAYITAVFALKLKRGN